MGFIEQDNFDRDCVIKDIADRYKSRGIDISTYAVEGVVDSLVADATIFVFIAPLVEKILHIQLRDSESRNSVL